MSSIRPVSKTAHAAARWLRFKDLLFTAADPFSPLVMSEARRASACMPIGFLKREDQLLPVAIQGLKPGKNLLLAPDGRWMPNYIPAVYRGYPFSVRENSRGEQLFCVDEGSGLVTGIDAEGDSDAAIDNREEPFFDASGEMSESLTQVFEFAKAIAVDRLKTRAACAQILDCDVLVPWHIPFEEDGQKLASKGMLRVDEERLNALDAEPLHALQRCGALNLLFCHLISVPQVALLQRFNTLQKQVESQRFDPETDSVDELLGLPDADVIEFGF